MHKKLCSMAVLLMLLPTLFTVTSNAVVSGAKWTFMVYVDADNNLDPAGIDDINEMEMVGSTVDVNIVVLLDRWDEKYVAGSWIYYITRDEDPEAITSPIVKGLGEVNMGDPATLRGFVEFAFANYPADRFDIICLMKYPIFLKIN